METTETGSPGVLLTLSTFDNSSQRPAYRALRAGVPLDAFEPITHDDYRPCGGTPLLDATVEFIEHLRSQRRDDAVIVGLLLDESGSMGANRDAVIESANEFVDGLRAVAEVDPEVAGKGFLVIATDGQENASTKFGYDAVRRTVRSCEDDGWITVFIGASIDGWGAGRSIGLSGGATGQTISTVNTPHGHRSAMASVTSDASSYLASSSQYMNMRKGSGTRSIAEDGSELSTNIGAQGGPAHTPHAHGGGLHGGHGFAAADALSAVTEALTPQ